MALLSVADATPTAMSLCSNNVEVLRDAVRKVGLGIARRLGPRKLERESWMRASGLLHMAECLTPLALQQGKP
jgi:hypothetical protein